jgi:adenine-specific DNA glycosylase
LKNLFVSVSINSSLQIEKKKPRDNAVAVCVIQRIDNESQKKENEYLLVQRPETGLLASLWEFPSLELNVSNSNENPNTQNVLNDQKIMNFKYESWKPMMDAFLKNTLGLNWNGMWL